MAPKAMKGVKAMKAFPQKKAMKSSVSSPCQKDKKSRQKVKKGVLKKNNLDKLGKLTLAEKVAKAAEGAETAEEAAQELKGMLTKQEHSRVWSKYNCHLKGQPKKEQKEFEKANKGAKGMLAALHMVKSSVPKFPHCSEFLESSSSLRQKEKWVSETKMVELFGQEEFYLHLVEGSAGGRIPGHQESSTTRTMVTSQGRQVSKRARNIELVKSILQEQKMKKHGGATMGMTPSGTSMTGSPMAKENP